MLAAQIAQRVGDVSLVDTARGRPGAGGDSRSRVRSSPEIVPPGPLATASGEIQARPSSQSDGMSHPAHAVEIPHSTDDITQPGVHTPVQGEPRFAVGTDQRRREGAQASAEGHRGAILGVGTTQIGRAGDHGPGHAADPSRPQRTISGEIGPRIAPGSRVLVPGPNGLMQSATVRQLLQGYYELEVGSSGETIWVPISGVVPEG